jgi:hypothetical protein
VSQFIVIALFNLVSALTLFPWAIYPFKSAGVKAIMIGWEYTPWRILGLPWRINPGWSGIISFYGLYYAFTEGSANAMVANLYQKKTVARLMGF